MNVDVRIESADLNSALRTYIKRRLHFSLGRFAGTLGRVGVRVEDVPGAGDVPDASCRIPVELLPTRRTLRQEAVDENLNVAIDLATERELECARSLGAVRNSEAAASHSRRRRFK